MSSSVPVTCSWLASFSIIKLVISYEFFYAKSTPLLAEFSITKPLPPEFKLFLSSTLITVFLYSPNSLSQNLCYPYMGSFLLTICPLLTPFPAKKALFPHMSSFMLTTWPLLGQFSIRNALLSHRSSFLLLACICPIINQKTFVIHIWALF